MISRWESPLTKIFELTSDINDSLQWQYSFSFWPMSEVCRYPAGIRTSVRGLQVPCRYPDRCQRFAGTVQLSWPVSEVRRYPAGIVTSVSGLQKLTHWVFWFWISPGASSEDLQLAPTCRIEKITLWVGFLYLLLGPIEVITKDRVCGPIEPMTVTCLYVTELTSCYNKSTTSSLFTSLLHAKVFGDTCHSCINGSLWLTRKPLSFTRVSSLIQGLFHNILHGCQLRQVGGTGNHVYCSYTHLSICVLSVYPPLGARSSLGVK